MNSLSNFINNRLFYRVVGVVTWPLNSSEAEVDLVLIKTSLLLSPDQTIATCQHNVISQHCWAQYAACVWPPCCDMLSVVGSNFTSFKLEPTTPRMVQHIATRWPNARNMLRPTMLRYVALTCWDCLAGALLCKSSCQSYAN